MQTRPSLRRFLPLAALLCSLSATARVLPAQTPYQNKTQADLAAEWWQWAASTSDETNPVRDHIGEHCAVGQKGKVWFLAGGFGNSKIRRSCTIPAGKALFFPIINMVHWPRQGVTDRTCATARRKAALNNDTALDLFAEIDGVPVEKLKKHRVATERCFNLFGRIPAAERPYEAFPAATDGYWLLLKPLKQGRHVLKFGGRYNQESDQYGTMIQDIEYELEVR